MPISELDDLTRRRLAQKYSPEASDRMAEVILFGELIGRPTHGILRTLPDSRGAMDEPGDESVEVEHTGPSAARIVGRPGMLVALEATDLLIELGRGGGPAVVTTRGSLSTSGSLTFYLERITDAGLVGMIVTNTLSVVTVPGGRGPILGTNPMAIGVPSTGLPFIFDMGTSAITGGEVVGAIATGRDLPEGVAIGPDGLPTVDPRDVFAGGGLLPFGGHKGMGISMAIEVLAGVLAGSAAAPVREGEDWGHVFIGIPLAALGDPDELRARCGEILGRMTGLPTADGAEVRIPGHRSLATRDAALATGSVDVDAESLDRLRRLVDG